MSVIKELYDIIRDLQKDAKKLKNNELLDKLCDIKLRIDELEEENKQLKEKLNIKYNSTYDQETNSFIINDDPNHIRYCAICYGKTNKLIPLRKNNKCLVCEEDWHKSFANVK